MLSKENLYYIKTKYPEIAIISPPLDSIPTRSGNAIYTLVEQIAKYSAKPIILFSVKPNSNSLKSLISERIIYYPKEVKRSFIQRILGYRITKRIFGHYNIHYYSYYKACYQICRRVGIKLVLQEDSIEALNLKYKFQGKIILHIHAITRPEAWQKIKNNICEIVFVSRTSKEIHNKGHEKFTSKVILNGIDLNLFRIQRSGEKRDIITFLFAGRMSHSKGLLQLCRAFSLITNPKVRLLIIGDPHYQTDDGFLNEFHRLIHRDSRIDFIGPISNEHISDYYNHTDFVVCPSIGQEGLPKVISESLVMGIPVITSDRGGIRELIINNYNGLIIEEPVCEVTIKAMLESAVEKHYQLCQNAFTDAQRVRNVLSLEKMVNEFDKLFNQHLK